MLRLNPICPRGNPVADLVRLDVGHTHPRSLITTTAEVVLTEVTTAKPAHRMATVTEALAVTTMKTGHRAIVHPLAGQWKITRHLEPAMRSLTAAIIHHLLPTLMPTAVDLPMTGHQENFLLGSQHTLEKDMRETTIVVDATGKFYSSLFHLYLSWGPRCMALLSHAACFLYVFYFIRSLSWRN